MGSISKLERVDSQIWTLICINFQIALNYKEYYNCCCIFRQISSFGEMLVYSYTDGNLKNPRTEYESSFPHTELKFTCSFLSLSLFHFLTITKDYAPYLFGIRTYECVLVWISSIISKLSFAANTCCCCCCCLPRSLDPLMYDQVNTIVHTR